MAQPWQVRVTDAHGNNRYKNLLSELSSTVTTMGNTTATNFNIPFFSL
jgi:hypothetical protein